MCACFPSFWHFFFLLSVSSYDLLLSDVGANSAWNEVLRSTVCTRHTAGAFGPIGVRGPRHNGGDSRAAHVGPRNCTAAAERVLNGCASAMMALSRDRVTQTCFQSDISRLVTEWPCSSAMAGERWGPERSLCRVIRPQGPQPGLNSPGPRRSAKPEAPPADPTGLLRCGQPSLVVNTREPAALRMSKLSFRARALDASKPMPIYMAEELPDLPDYSAINRAVPQMPSGMEKEEECVSRNVQHLVPACFPRPPSYPRRKIS